ncbi:hypothetical protein [Calidithermus timidus]|uniref:hypothetical protein n=1 Tax=Calidithermus timidus TaxID=307124 RepID=UPI0012F6DF91|nr:hypothetical protein [Calidithermus timidus]
MARIVSPGEIRLGISALLTGIEHPALATLPPRPLLGALVHSATHMLLLNDQRRVAVVDAYATPRLSRLLRGCYAQHWAALQAGGDSILLAYPILANLPYALYPGEIGPLAAELYVSAPSVLAALEAVLDLDLVTPAQDVWGGSLPQGVVDNALEKSLAQALQPLVTDATPTPNPFRGDTTRGYRPWVGQAHWGGLEARGGDSEPGMLAFYRGLNLPRLALFWIAYGSRAC